MYLSSSGMNTFIINRNLSPFLYNKAHFSLLYSTYIDYKYLRVSGCLCFASTLTSQWTKFHPRAKPCVFMGYPSSLKGYKLYDILSKFFIISKDVFHEHLFPFQSIPHRNDSIDPFPYIVLPKRAQDVDLFSKPIHD